MDFIIFDSLNNGDLNAGGGYGTGFLATVVENLLCDLNNIRIVLRIGGDLLSKKS